MFKKQKISAVGKEVGPKKALVCRRTITLGHYKVPSYVPSSMAFMEIKHLWWNLGLFKFPGWWVFILIDSIILCSDFSTSKILCKDLTFNKSYKSGAYQLIVKEVGLSFKVHLGERRRSGAMIF